MGAPDQDSPHIVLICDGMSNARVNPASRYTDNQENLGRHEISRLLGIGRQFGQGPLATFLRAAVDAQKNGAKIHMISLKSSPLEYDESLSDLSEFPSELADIFSLFHIIEAESGKIPWHEICESISTFIDQPITGATIENLNVRFIIVGCSTEGRPFTIATHLINGMGFKEVAVSTHLLGSAEREAHFAALRHTYAIHGIKVILDLGDAWEYAGMHLPESDLDKASPCIIEPSEIRKELGADREKIVELLCLHWSRCLLQPLSGGFSGSFLFVAKGWKSDAQTEPMVLKIDNFSQMRREINGYFEVKDLLGKHIPNFGYPVFVGGIIGVGMELATMDGNPETLQDKFEQADIENTAALFHTGFEKALTLLCQRLYANTQKLESVAPYHQLGLSDNIQVTFLQQNIEVIESYINKIQSLKVSIDFSKLPQIYKIIVANDDEVDSETCVSHGDLNLQNIICDNVGNVWFIDWVHCGRYPVEVDFAKLENDIKFVMSKEFDLEDLPQLKKFENYILANKIPAEDTAIPDNLRFVKWDLRYRKMLSSIRLIRSSCFSLKSGNGWLIYQIALLKYAAHTLSFDKQRDRGECNLQQLIYALFSTEQLMMNLVVDDFHLKIRGAKHHSYPVRQRVSIDYASWRIQCPEYLPPYYVASSVIENDYNKVAAGWADPEETRFDTNKSDGLVIDNKGKPLHPRGRTGLSGRGVLGKWGANPAVNCVLFRGDSNTNSLEVFLCKKETEGKLTFPQGFVLPGQSEQVAISQVLENKCGWVVPVAGDIISTDIAYDERQTDNAWIVMTTFSLLFAHNESPDFFSAVRSYEEVCWWKINDELFEHMHPSQKEYLLLAAKKILKKHNRYSDHWIFQ